MPMEAPRFRSRELDLTQYNTDKIPNGYLSTYDPIFAPMVDQEIRLFELGVFKGESLRLWRDYFPKSVVVGLDRKPAIVEDPSRRIHVYQGPQDDKALLTRIACECAPYGFDIIIDDASHTGDLTKASFWYLFEHHLKPGGLYVIEDWGTGYWSDWPDGRCYRSWGIIPIILRGLRWLRLVRGVYFHSHNWGMVGFIKQLVDEQGAHDLTRRSVDKRPIRQPQFTRILVTPSIVFVTKAEESSAKQQH